MTQPAVADAQPQAAEPPDDPKPFVLPDHLRPSLAPELLATLDKPSAEAAPDAAAPSPDAVEAASPDEQFEMWVTQLDENPNTLARIPRANQVEVISEWKARFEEAAIGAMRTAYEQGQREAVANLQMTSTVAKLDQLLDEGDIPAFKESVAKFPGGEKNYYRVKADMQPIAADSPEHFQNEANALFQQLADYPDVQKVFADNWNYTADAAGMRKLSLDIGKALGRLEAGEKPQDPAAQALARRKAATVERRAVPRPPTTDGGSDPSLLLNREFIKNATAQQLMKYTTAQLQEGMKR